MGWRCPYSGQVFLAFVKPSGEVPTDSSQGWDSMMSLNPAQLTMKMSHHICFPQMLLEKSQKMALTVGIV